MIPFTKFDDFYPVARGETLYELGGDVVWEIGKKGSKWELDLPKGTRFDISVPECLTRVQSPHDRAVLLAALIHDVLLRKGRDVAFASSEFRRAAIARGCSKFRAWALFASTLIYTSLSQRQK